jgi:hypothetical protein
MENKLKTIIENLEKDDILMLNELNIWNKICVRLKHSLSDRLKEYKMKID